MLETFRKHHYILMCLVAVVVIISFTFFFNPNSKFGESAGSGAVFAKFNGADLTSGEIDNINQLQAIVFQTAAGENEGGREFGMTMGSVVDETQPRNRQDLDPDYAINVFIMRQECERLGIAVEKEDVEKRLRSLSAFQTSGRFDGSKLDEFLNSGRHGDLSATQGKLITAIKDVMLFERLSQLVGGSYAPSAQEIDTEFAAQNESTTVATALVEKKPFETQTVTDEEIQKEYDIEKEKKEKADKATAEGEAKGKDGEIEAATQPVEQPDPIILTEEKRTVQYCITEAPKLLAVAPTPPRDSPPVLPTKPNIDALPEDQKKAKEEEWKKQEAEHKVKMDAYNAAIAGYTKAHADYNVLVKQNEEAKRDWLKTVNEMTDAIVADPADRAGRTFADLAKIIEPRPKAVPAPAPAPAPAPVPAPGTPPVPTPDAPPLKPEGATPPVPPAPAPAPAPSSSAPAPSSPPPPAPDAAPKPNAVQGAQGPAGKEGQPSSTTPATPPAAPATPEKTDPAAPPTAVPPAETTPAPAPATTPAAAPPAIAPAPAVTVPAPLPFFRTATFTASSAPPEIQVINGAEGSATSLIFKASKGAQEAWVENSDKSAYLFFVVTDIAPPAVRPLAEVKELISNKLKEKKVTENLKKAGEDARAKLLEELKGGKSFKEAAELAKTVPAELPAYSSENPLPRETPNGGMIRMTVMGRGGKAGLQTGEVSDPLPVPEGLLLVYVVKKELPKFPDTEDRKKKIRESQSISGAGTFQGYMPMLNPVFKSWFAGRRSAAQSATP